jgi:hypothetical protein
MHGLPEPDADAGWPSRRLSDSTIRINTLIGATAGHALLARRLRKRLSNPNGPDREAFDEAS